MRLRLEQFSFQVADTEFVVKQHGKTRILARGVRDKKHPGMWRVVRSGGFVSGMLNFTRAKDLAVGVAETALYLGGLDRAPTEPTDEISPG